MVLVFIKEMFFQWMIIYLGYKMDFKIGDKLIIDRNELKRHFERPRSGKKILKLENTTTFIEEIRYTRFEDPFMFCVFPHLICHLKYGDGNIRRLSFSEISHIFILNGKTIELNERLFEL